MADALDTFGSQKGRSIAEQFMCVLRDKGSEPSSFRKMVSSFEVFERMLCRGKENE